MSKADEPATRFAEGDMVDHFQVVRLLGRGGFGDVYLARDIKLGRKVALKVVHPRYLGSDEAVERFLFEARATARFNHPHIVTVYAVGEHEGAPYVALEYLPGQSLRDRLRQELVGLGEVLRIGLAVAEALAEAHASGILHRDLKPENILIPTDGRLRVVDFGLAKPTALDEQEDPELVPIDPADLSTSDTLVQSLPGPDTLVEAYRTFGKGGVVCGSPGYMAPEQWRAQPQSEATDVWALGVVLYELLSGELPFRITNVAELARAVSGPDPVCTLNPRVEIPEELARLVMGCLHKLPGRRVKLAEVKSTLGRMMDARRPAPAKAEQGAGPFRGLLPFGEEHAAYFFGREAEVAAAVERLRADSATLSVVGPSGAGKSSFVQAGVVPRLREMGRWTVLRLRPGATPFRSIASRLRRGDSITLPMPAEGKGGPLQRQDDDALLVERLMEAPARLGLMLRQLAAAEECNVLLFVDQLEELYTHVESGYVRRRFMEALALAADDVEEPVRVVTTLRDDFLGRVAEGPEARRVVERVTVLQRPGREALEEILTRPLEVAGYRYEEPDMVGEMIESVGEEPAGLPLLQFTARVLWERRDRDRKILLRAVYDEVGGVAGALASHADRVLEGLSSMELAAARELLLRLVTADSTRRTVERADLLEGLGDDAPKVLDRLVGLRLISVQRGPEKEATLPAQRRSASEEAALELAHESLIRTWRRLARWLEESEEERAFLAEVGQAAELWHRRGRRDQEVWRGPALADAIRSLARCRTRAPDVVRQFLTAGQRRERRGRRLTITSVALAMTVVVAAATLWVLTLARKEREARELSSWAQLESAKLQLSTKSFEEGRAWLRGALELQDSREARRTWWQLRRALRVWQRSFDGHVNAIAISPDGRQAALGVSDNPIVLVDLARHTVSTLGEKTKGIVKLDYSPDGRTLLVGTDARIALWDLQRRAALDTFKGEEKGCATLRFSPTGREVVCDRDKHLQVLGLDGRRSKRPIPAIFGLGYRGDTLLTVAGSPLTLYEGLEGPSRPLSRRTVGFPAVFSPDGKRLAVADIRSGDVVFWDTRTAKVRARIPAGQLVRSMRFLPDSRRIAIGLNDGEVAIWSLDPPRRLESIKAGPGWLRAITFTPDGRWMMTGSREGRVMLWDLRFIDRGVTALDQPVTDLDFAPDGGTLAAAAMDGTVILRYVTCGRKMLRFRAHDGAVRALRFSPDGSLLATSGANGAVRLWSGRTARKIADLLGHRREVGALAFSPDGKLLASGGARGYVRVWSMNTRMETRRIQFGKGIASLSFHPRGRLLAVAGHEKHVRVFDAETGTRYWESREQIPVLRATFLQNGRLAVQLPMGLLQVHDVETRDPPTTVSRRISAVTIRFGTNDSLWALSAKGPFCSTCGALVLDRTGKATRRAWGHRQSITHMAVHPSGKLVATGAYDNAVKLWRIDDGQEVWRSLLLLDSPPRLYSHQGVVALDTGKITPAEEERGRRWQRAVWDRGRLGRAAPAPSSLLCLQTLDDKLELWDRSRDRRLGVVVQPGILDLWATERGCITLTGGKRRTLSLHRRDGGVQRLAEGDIERLTAEGDRVWVVVGGRAQVHDARTGKLLARRDLSAGASAVLPVGRDLLIGHGGGLLARLPAGGDARLGLKVVTQDLPRSAVMWMVPGPDGVVAVGQTNGAVSVWDRDRVRLWLTDRLHGPPSHVRWFGHRLYVASETGDWRTFDLSVLKSSYCDLMRQVWREVPEVWKEGQLEPGMPGSHECIEGG